MTDTLTVNLVSKADGSIDQEASEQAFADQLAAHCVERETSDSLIAGAVSALFAENKGKAITLPTLSNLAGSRLGATPENWSVITGRVADYVRANSQGKTDKETKVEERPTSLFVISKGAGRGVYFRADMPVKA